MRTIKRIIIHTQLELREALRRSRCLEAENQLLREQKGYRLIARSPVMEPVLQIIERVGPSDANVLITGENGTGKGLVARALHSVSPRAGKPVVTVNMGGLSEGVFESELFGHVKGAFTDAKADRVGRFELPMAARFFSMKSPICRSRIRPGCCACWRPASSSGSAPPKPARPMCA